MLQVTLTAVYVVLFVRFGLLALLAAFLLGGLSKLGSLSLDPSSPLFGVGLFITAVAFAIAAFGFQTSLAGRPLMSDALPRA
jgi:hypothetical protein